jgi:hypothetical protein
MSSGPVVQRKCDACSKEEVAPPEPSSSWVGGFDLTRIPVHPPERAKGGQRQAALAIGKQGDQFEKEADGMAEAVMGHPARALPAGNVSRQMLPPLRVQRTCASPTAAETVQRKTDGGSAAQASAPPVVHDVLRSSGEPIDHTTRTTFEPRFGHDFSQVRIHADETAARSAQAVGALAYTVGHDLVFGAGQYQPQSAAGQSLLAHELAHVVQQTACSGTSGPILQRQVIPGATFEHPPPTLVAGSISPQFAQALSTDELEYDLSLLLARVDATPARTAEHEALRANLDVLEAEAQRRGHRSAALAEHAVRQGVIQLMPELHSAMADLRRMSSSVERGAEILAHDRDRAVSHLGRITSVLDEAMTTLNLAAKAPPSVRVELVRLAGVRMQAALFAMYAFRAGMAYLEVGHQLVGHPFVSAESVLGTTWKAWDRVDIVINQLCSLTDAAVEKGALAALALVPQLADELEAYVRQVEHGVEVAGKIALVASIVEMVTTLAAGMRGFGPRLPAGFATVVVPTMVGMRGGVAVMGQVVISAEWLEMIRHLVQIGALSSTVAAGAIKASGISMASGIGDDPKATADKLAKEPKPAEPLTETNPEPPKTSGSPKRVPAQQPSSPPGWKDTMSAFGKEIGWPGAGKVKVPAATADLAKLRAAGVTEEWAVEQARIYREVARLNPSNPTAAIRAEWLEVIAVRLRGVP